MVSCPKCESTAQVRLVRTDYNEDGWSIEVVRIYTCGCGCRFKGSSYYTCQEAYEVVEPISQTYSNDEPTRIGGMMVRKMIEFYEKNS